eukprot:GHRQ01021930.1.p2 GENE.GHRQ01021930.1~~GHRQ01021930.1.p2  ORF type:complete len:133 (-),score=17.50 GHRQ01021930.1:358-756(-)
MASAAAPLLAMLLLAVLFDTSNAQEWKLGRSTYFGASALFSATFDPYQGEGSFGVLAGASCGFTNSDNSIPFPRDAVAAVADSRPDYPGELARASGSSDGEHFSQHVQQAAAPFTYTCHSWVCCASLLSKQA